MMIAGRSGNWLNAVTMSSASPSGSIRPARFGLRQLAPRRQVMDDRTSSGSRKGDGWASPEAILGQCWRITYPLQNTSHNHEVNSRPWNIGPDLHRLYVVVS